MLVFQPLESKKNAFQNVKLRPYSADAREAREKEGKEIARRELEQLKMMFEVR